MRPSIAARTRGSVRRKPPRFTKPLPRPFGGKGMTMKRSFPVLAILTVALLLPGVAEARGRSSRGGSVNTPFGQFSSGTMQQAGGNPFMAQQLQQQQMMYQQQQMMMKQQQQYMQQMQKLAKDPEYQKQMQQQSTSSGKALATSGTRK